MGFRHDVQELVPDNPRDKLRGLPKLVDESYRDRGLEEGEVSVLKEELSGKGRPEFPVVGIPHGDFYQRLGDRWVQRGTEKDSVEEDHNERVSLYDIRREPHDFIKDDHQEKFPGETGESVRRSIDNFDNTFSDMGEVARPFMEYAAEITGNTNGLDAQEWYNPSFETDDEVMEAFDYFVERTQSTLREIFQPQKDSITMLRGVSTDAVEESGEWRDDELVLESGCVEHWTTSPTAASNYGDGYIIVADIPVDDILAANPVNSGTVMNLPESYVARGTETYGPEDVYTSEEADALEFAERIVDSVS